MVIEAVRKDERALEYASEELRGDKEEISLLHDSGTIANPIQPSQREINDVMQEIVSVKEADKETQKGDGTSQYTETEGR